MKGVSKAGHRAALLGAGLFCFSMTASGEKAPGPSYSGSLRAEYDYRSMGDYSDNDAYGFWYYRARNLADQRVEIYTSGRLHSDLDGTGSSPYDPYASLDDDSELRLLQFYVDIHHPDQTYGMRYGRQYVDVADYIQMDGAQLRLFEQRTVGGRVFIGQPVSEYTSINGDLFLGASLVGHPWDGNESRATYARYQDDSAGKADDNFVFDVRQRLSEEVRGRGYLSIMNGDVRLGGADLLYVSMEDKVLDAVLGLRRWGDFDAGTRAYSPLVDVMGDMEPFAMAYGRITAETVSWLYLSPGVMMQEPDQSDYTNRSFERFDLSFILEPSDGLNATVSLEYWNVEDDDRFFSVSGDVRYRYGRLWELVLGAAYVDYTYLELADYSVFTDDNPAPPIIQPLDGTRVERTPDAFTYYLRGRWNITEKTSLRISGEIEDDSDQDDLAYQLRTSFEVRL